MVSDRKLANAVAGKSARACDSCVRKRARWYCAADDAFLCQSCDSSVHSANPLARRHERVRLKTGASTFDVHEYKHELQTPPPSWHQGFAKKPRTPRQKKPEKNPLIINNPRHHLVPEICCSEEQSHEENDEQLLYRVPTFVDTDIVQNDVENMYTRRFGSESKAATYEFSQEMNHLEGILPSEFDIAEYESLLGKGLEDESFDMEGLGILDCDENGKESKEECFLVSGRIKVEDEEVGEVVMDEENDRIDVGRETFELSFDYGEPIIFEEGENGAQNGEFMNLRKKGKVDDYRTFLKLDYEGVMAAWDDQKSLWTTGGRPEFNPGDCWPDCLGTSGTMHVYGDMGMMSGHTAAAADGGREARVSRYREKRRTRLFSKKIRYEVRKLNAEKRPRMKGRFVKRANFAASAFPLLK